MSLVILLSAVFVICNTCAMCTTDIVTHVIAVRWSVDW